MQFIYTLSALLIIASANGDRTLAAHGGEHDSSPSKRGSSKGSKMASKDPEMSSKASKDPEMSSKASKMSSKGSEKSSKDPKMSSKASKTGSKAPKTSKKSKGSPKAGSKMSKASASGGKMGKQNGGGDMTPVNISIQPTYTGIPFFMAMKMGWFEELGLDVTMSLVSFRSRYSLNTSLARVHRKLRPLWKRMPGTLV